MRRCIYLTFGILAPGVIDMRAKIEPILTIEDIEAMKLRSVVFISVLMLFSSGSLLAQGLFRGFGFPRTVTATGQAEVLGPILVTMVQGPAVAGTMVVDVSPLQITNANAADISVNATGLTVGATTIDTDNHLVKIPVMAGGGASGSIRLEGIRVAVAGVGINSFNAKLSWPDSLNVLIEGTSVPVIDAVRGGLTAQSVGNRFTVFNGQVYGSGPTIRVSEGYASAFSNSSQFGQTNSTKIQIRVTDFPDNLQMIFPTAVTANESAATLNAFEGVTLPRANGRNELTYVFSKAANSDETTESFDIQFTINVLGPVPEIQPTIEVGLAPIGGVSSSTDIPRYAEDEITVQEGSSRIISKILYWTGINASLQNQVHMTNPSSRTANLTIDALNSAGQAISGTGIINPAKVSLSANQSMVSTISSLFGTTTSISSIRIQSTNPDLLAAAVVSGNGASGSVPFVSRAISSAFFPVVNEGAQLQLMNPNSSTATGTLTLRTEDAQVVTSANVSIAPLASTAVAVQTAFNSPPSGYISAVFSNPVIAFESFGETKPNLVAIQPPASANPLFIPFVVSLSGLQTDVDLINLSDQTVTLKAQLFGATGSQPASASLITMLPGEQLAASIERIFTQLPPTGYVRLDVPQVFKAFFGYYPAIAGLARIRSLQGGSTVIPLSAYALADAFVLGFGVTGTEFQGLALVNPTASDVSVNLQALNINGTLAAAASITLAAGQVVSRLTSEFFGTALPAQPVIRVTSSAPIAITAISGSATLDQFRALPVLR